MRADVRFAALMLGMAALLGLFLYWGVRADRRLEQLETLRRAPTAPPLQEMRGGVRYVASSQTVYVPVYSHIYAGGGQERLLEVTLSIRNTDPRRSIVVSSVRYNDTAGRQIAEYLEAPVVLGPLASTDFLVEHRDRAGGSGASFLIDWAAEENANQPVIEAVMVSLEGNRAFAFVRPGYPISTLEGEDGSATPP